VHDSHLINPLIRLSICKLDMTFVGLKLYIQDYGCDDGTEDAVEYERGKGETA
jgi:hypothetical protein